MDVCLISAPTATDFEEVRDAQRVEVRKATLVPQLGVLVLAATLDQRGHPPDIVNLNQRYYDYLQQGGLGVDRFASWVADAIVATGADVFGFSSISSSYPVTIRIAECVKRTHADCTVLFGGPQASVVDLRTLAAFPFIDYVLRGEADETLPLFLNELAGGRNFAIVPGLAWRSPLGPCRNPNAPVIRDLDALPAPAFHLTGELAHAESAPLELGRGCPFACTFCSTNDFFRRNFRLRSPQRVLADMRWIASKWGIRSFELAHDMFTVDRRKVAAFCECMIASGEDFTWGCSARTDCVDEELLGLMACAGCRAVFFGVESGSQRMQRVMEKDLDVQRAREIVSLAERAGIRTTVSVITGFPEETWEDVRETVSMYMHALGHPGSSPQLNLLAPLAETPIHSKYRDQLTLEELSSNQGHQGRRQNSLDRELIRKFPDIFPNFYLLPMPHLDRYCLLELREFLLTAPTKFRWLLISIQRSGADILDVFSAWRKHRLRRQPDLHGWGLRSYYLRDQSRAEFSAFVLEYLGMNIPAPVECLARYYHSLACARVAETIVHQGESAVLPLLETDIPLRAPRVNIIRVDWDVAGVIECLKAGGWPAEVDRSPRFFRTQPKGEDLHVIRSTPLIGTGLEACNGENTVADFVNELADAFDGPVDARRLSAECLLKVLSSEGLISVYRPTLPKSVSPQHPAERVSSVL